MSLPTRSAGILLTLVATLAPIHAQQSAQPQLHISTEHNQTTFHIGERIPLVLSFTGPNDKSFAIDLATYDRSGRLTIDAFDISPSIGWVDPLANYFRYGSFMMGGIRGGANLSSKPILVHDNLNEWVRFNEPGTYTLVVTSHRVGRSDKSKDHFNFPRGEVLLKSQPLEIKIVAATLEWQHATLHRIQQTLKAHRFIRDLFQEGPSERDLAMADLRYLASPDAVKALAPLLTEPDGTGSLEAFFGIIALPRALRDDALHLMGLLIDDPSFPISISFLDAMPWLQIDDKMPAASASSSSDEDTLRVRLYFPSLPEPTPEERRQHDTKLSALERSAWERVALALPRKQGAALTVTSKTLLDRRPENPSDSAKQQLGAITRASFAGFSDFDKSNLLSYHWEMLRSRELLPQLRAAAVRPPNPAGNDSVEQNNDDVLRVPALRRWYEFEPEAARAEVVKKIGSATPEFSAEEIDYIPADSFPQFDSLWARAYAEKQSTYSNNLGSLLVHFGTGTAVPQMVSMLSSNPDRACDIAAMTYLVRFDPSEARRFLLPSPTDPWAKNLQCSTSHLADIAKSAQDPVLTEAAIAMLQSPTPANIADALRYLTSYGDDSAREPILTTFLNWSERWSAHSEDLDEDAPRALRDDENLGMDFPEALLGNQGWIPDADLKTIVQKHCHGKWMCDQVQRMIDPNLDVAISTDSNFPQHTIGPYSPPTMKLFEAKLDQFPSGTTFQLQHVQTYLQEDQDKLEATLPALFAKHGMKLLTNAP